MIWWPTAAKPVRTRPVSGAQVRAYAAKANEYALAAANEFAAGRNIAATSLAIHAAINAADAVCGARLGRRAAGEDHEQALVLLRQAGKDGAAIETDLARLLPLKTRAEYDPEDVAPQSPPRPSSGPNAATPSRTWLPKRRRDRSLAGRPVGGCAVIKLDRSVAE